MATMSKAKAENRSLPKRFYKQVTIERVDGAFAIMLDGKMVRTPQQKLLQTVSQQLAQQIALEWEVQDPFIDTDTMPLTRLLNIALDRVAQDRQALLTEITGYAVTDLLCYRAPRTDAALPIDSKNEELRALQVQHFDPILEWLEKEYIIRFALTEGLMPVPQPETSLQKIAAIFAAASDHELAALALMVPLLGSALLTLAVWKRCITVEQALIAARLDESVQAESWGRDEEAAKAWSAKERDIKAAAFFLTIYA